MLIDLGRTVYGADLCNAIEKAFLEFEQDIFFDSITVSSVNYRALQGLNIAEGEKIEQTLSFRVYKEMRPTVVDELITLFMKLLRKSDAEKKSPDKSRYLLFELPTIRAEETYDKITVKSFDVWEIYDIEFGYYKGTDKKEWTSPPQRALDYLHKFREALMRHLENQA